MKNLRTRKQNRLKNYDYSKGGFYFITMCSKNRENIFGHISVGADGRRPVDGRGDGPVDGRGDGPVDGRGDGPVDGRGDGPVDGRGDGPVDERGDGPVDGRGDGPVDGRGDGPVDGRGIQLNEFGRIVEEELKKSQRIRKEIMLDQYVIMPNHVHCIIVIEQGDLHNTGRQPSDTGRQPSDTGRQPSDTGRQPSDTGRQPSDTGRQPSAHTYGKRSLSSFVQGFKSAVTTRINILRNMPGKPVWQRSFHDRIIRNEKALIAIRNYIANNPMNWEQDIDNLTDP
jgi:putative transposase